MLWTEFNVVFFLIIYNDYDGNFCLFFSFFLSLSFSILFKSTFFQYTQHTHTHPSIRLFSEHVWEVQVHRRGLAVEKNIVGTYHLCLTDKALRLSQTGSRTTQTGERRMPYVEFLLTTIRRYVLFLYQFYLSFLLLVSFFVSLILLI